jgi:hypothetical protein
MNPYSHTSSDGGNTVAAPLYSYALPTQQAVDNQMLKRGIWLYFLLLIFEGALRKWVLPGLASPLLVVRDPLAIWLIYKTWKSGQLPDNFYLSSILIVNGISFIATLALGHGNLVVAAYGLRIMLFHFPLLFVIGRIFDRSDVIKMGRATLWIAIPMTVLVAIQFYSPQSAWVNRGVGGDMEGAGFSGAMGFFRPPGTFSFTNGNTLFYGFVACFLFYFWLDTKQINRLVLLAATIALFIMIPISLSRGLFFQIGVSVIFAFLIIAQKPGYIGHFFVGIVIFAVVLAGLSFIPFVQTAIEAFLFRFDSASDIEGGLKGTLGDRFLGGMVSALSDSADMPFFGYGMGMGTNAGSVLLQGGTERTFLIAEQEWARVIGEMGPLLGMLVIVIRLVLCIKISLASYHKLAVNDLLPWMLLSFGVLNVLQGQWAQPTALGFSTLIGGLMIASLRNNQPAKRLASR